MIVHNKENISDQTCKLTAIHSLIQPKQSFTIFLQMLTYRYILANLLAGHSPKRKKQGLKEKKRRREKNNYF